MPNDTYRCHNRMCAIWLLFLLLRELAGNALCKILVAMAELSFGEHTRSSRHALIELSSIYFCALSSPTEGTKFSSTLAREKVQTTVDGNKSTSPAWFYPQKPSWVCWVLGNHIRPSSFKCASLDTQMGLRSGPQSCIRTYFLTDTNFHSRHFGVEEASKRTKQLCLVGGHFYFGTRGCTRNSKLRP